MHYLGFVGVPRRYYEMYESPFIGTSTVSLNQFITIAAITVGLTQIVFLYNIITSSKFGKKANRNPWEACSLEWQTADVPPTHGNFGAELPIVYRWAYDFSVPGAKDDFIPQNVAPSEVPGAKVEKT